MTGEKRPQEFDPGEIVRLLGGHPARAMGIDPSEDGGLGRWWVAAVLLGDRGPEKRAHDAATGLRRAGLDATTALAGADTRAVAAILDAVGHPRPGPTAARLVRSSRSLLEQHGGSLERLADRSDGLEALGAALASLAPGIGPATLQRFLAPLRERYTAAADLPLHPAALMAAQHLGWLDEYADPTDPGTHGALRDRCASTPAPTPSWIDLEAALERLGRKACRRKPPRRCPLESLCPMRRSGDGVD